MRVTHIVFGVQAEFLTTHLAFTYFIFTLLLRCHRLYIDLLGTDQHIKILITYKHPTLNIGKQCNTGYKVFLSADLALSKTQLLNNFYCGSVLYERKLKNFQ